MKEKLTTEKNNGTKTWSTEKTDKTGKYPGEINQEI